MHGFGLGTLGIIIWTFACTKRELSGVAVRGREDEGVRGKWCVKGWLLRTARRDRCCWHSMLNTADYSTIRQHGMTRLK